MVEALSDTSGNLNLAPSALTSASLVDLPESIRKDVLRQKEEEIANFFPTVDIREFINVAESSPNMTVSVKMCYLSSERLRKDNGTRVTFIDTVIHGVFESTADALHELTLAKRKSYIAQITVWYAKSKRGTSGKPFAFFRPNRKTPPTMTPMKNGKTIAKQCASSQSTACSEESDEDNIAMEGEAKEDESTVAEGMQR
ncbi:Hypothetical protein PHPALM_16103 [Phytophthora palmivora]|uniref:Uncharacterized protein n=1 Tax=Phytophthora palmivora TaxID=4796 RepID=A0A2P4XQL0_9STRA|nr:Hypothetical protein PHPALM_16103 [Phytophthora palmivora]